MIIFLVILSLIVLGVVVFIKTSPEFGSPKTLMNQEKVTSAENFKDGKFTNQEDMTMNIDFWTFIKFFLPKDTKPHNTLPIVKLDKNHFSEKVEGTRVTWFGHSAIMLEIDGKKVMLDPMLTDYPSPIKGFFVEKRYQPGLPLDPKYFPKMDAVLISHDHYDHLDYKSIKMLDDKVGHYYVPLGLGSHLISWGVDHAKITELAWWESAELDALKFSLTPTRHFSGRGLTDKNAKLWGAWVIEGSKDKIFFSGDSGYSKYFKEVGEKFGPFDLAFMECGQYNPAWEPVHMLPEQTVQASLDLRAKLMMPIHWGAFTLSMHTYNEPIIRAKEEADKKALPIVIPKMGESFTLGTELPEDEWWLAK